MRFPMSLSVAAISITFLQLSVCGHVTAAPTSGCDGGQAEGDKWFDGCRWCVCENSVPVCSSSACSEINALLPPCENVGKSWWDGCYRCSCLPDGIECRADRTCVALIKSRQFITPAAYILSQGACIKPQDNRCVCGVDGVPSCTADAIDRNSLAATTIRLVPNSRRRHARRLRPRRPMSSSMRTTPEFRSRALQVSTYRNEDGTFSRRFERPGPSWRRPRSRRSAVLSIERKHLGQERKPTMQQATTENAGHEGDDIKQIVKVRQARSTHPTIPTLIGDAQKSPSLLVSTDNRCRFGSRWYGGGLRCHCDRKGAITCGDPQFVASRIDGFLMYRTPCSEGEEWQEPRNCRFCECHVSGIALCWRSEFCPYPFVITPVIPIDDEDDDSPADDDDGPNWNRLSSDSEPDDDEGFTGNNGGLRTIEHRPRHVSQDAPPEDDMPGSGDDMNGTLIPIDPPSGHRQIRPPPRPPAIGSTTVIVRQCRPGRRWREGCERCSCNSSGQRDCTRRFCLRSRTPSRPLPGSSPGATLPGTETYLDQDFQIPPENWSSQRERPLPTIRPPPLTSCGPYQLEEIYYEDCNSCICRPTGPICTAMSC